MQIEKDKLKFSKPNRSQFWWITFYITLLCCSVPQNGKETTSRICSAVASCCRKIGWKLKRKSAGLPRTAAGPANVAAVRAKVQQSLRHSTSKLATVLQLSNRTIRKILLWDFHMHPYKIAIV